MEHGKHQKGKAPKGQHMMKNGKMMHGKNHAAYMAAEKKAKKGKK